MNWAKERETDFLAAIFEILIFLNWLESIRHMLGVSKNRGKNPKMDG